MKKYDIGIEEVLRRVVSVEANSIDEAIEKVSYQYDNEEIVLDSSNFCEKSIGNIYSKKLDKPININMKYDANAGILTIIQDENKEGKYVCDTVEDINSCLRTYISDYMENPEIPSDKEIDEVLKEEELER